MNIKFKRNLISDKYHSLEVYDCPIELLEQLTEHIGLDVTVENFYPKRAVNEWFNSEQSLYLDSKPNKYSVRNVRLDVFLSNQEFIEHMNFWDCNGVAAIFTQRSPIPFKATDLSGLSLYKALDNFGLFMVFFLASPSSSGWSEIVSQNVELIDMAESLLKNM